VLVCKTTLPKTKASIKTSNDINNRTTPKTSKNFRKTKIKEMLKINANAPIPQILSHESWKLVTALEIAPGEIVVIAKLITNQKRQTKILSAKKLIEKSGEIIEVGFWK
jgi:hypothetical protein